jgi:hypothetical protein
MKCNLRLLEENNIPYNFVTLLVGIQSNLIDSEVVINYTTTYLLSHPRETDPLITELALITPETQNVDTMLNAVVQKYFNKSIAPNTEIWDIEKRKFRYCLLLNLTLYTENRRELLEKVAEIYAYFDYPPDMEDFIYYMPAKNYDPSMHSFQENEERLVNLLHNFLAKEKNDLQKQS